jgi:hypothetical protein
MGPSQDQVDAIWKRVEAVSRHHDSLFESERAFYGALEHLTLKAWEVHQERRRTKCGT